MMNGHADRPVRVLCPPAKQHPARARPVAIRPAGRSSPRIAGDRHSRRVSLLKRVLPAVGLLLLVLVAVWPRLGPLLESVRLGFAAIDLRDAHELRMLNPRYAGIDRYNRPYVVTAAIGRQVPKRDDLMSLERPKGEMKTHTGASVTVTAATAMYQSQAQLLDLFEDVNLIHENGTRFMTRTAHVDVSANTAEGRDPVVGHGPSGDIAAQGFQILQKGDTVIFTGNSQLLLKGTKPSANPAQPPALPAEVAAAAAQIEAAMAIAASPADEAAAGLSAAAASEPPIPAALAAKPDATAAKTGGIVQGGAILPVSVGAKARRDGG